MSNQNQKSQQTNQPFSFQSREIARGQIRVVADDVNLPKIYLTLGDEAFKQAKGLGFNYPQFLLPEEVVQKALKEGRCLSNNGLVELIVAGKEVVVLIKKKGRDESVTEKVRKDDLETVLTDVVQIRALRVIDQRLLADGGENFRKALMDFVTAFDKDAEAARQANRRPPQQQKPAPQQSAPKPQRQPQEKPASVGGATIGDLASAQSLKGDTASEGQAPVSTETPAAPEAPSAPDSAPVAAPVTDRPGLTAKQKRMFADHDKRNGASKKGLDALADVKLPGSDNGAPQS
jgi:hypothetical protein